MRAVILLVFALAASVTFASSDPSSLGNSFLDLALSETPNGINTALQPSCIAALKTRTSSVRSEILKKHLVAIKDVPYNDVAGGVFYHYTNAKGAEASANANQASEIFSYLRSSKEHEPFLYVAGDDKSSRSYGNIQIRVHINPEKMIFFPMSPTAYALSSKERDPKWVGYKFGLANSGSSAFHEVYRLISSEIVSSDPTLAPCSSTPFSTFAPINILVLLALETDHVALIAYKGTQTDWFQVIDASVVDSLDVGVAPNYNGPMQVSVPGSKLKCPANALRYCGVRVH